MQDDNLDQQVVSAVSEIEYRLNLQSPWLARKTKDWMNQVSPTGRAEDRFLGFSFFPFLSLPRWLAGTFDVDLDQGFHSRLVYLSINCYLYTRMIDNIMDGHASMAELHLLPVTAFFHTEFQRTYQSYFEFSHPFWNHFQRFWLTWFAETIRTADLQNVHRDELRRTGGDKFSPAKIFLVSTAYHYRRMDALPTWLQFCDSLACLAQSADDLFDWHKDLSSGISSYFLAEAFARKQSEESAGTWIAREGFSWGAERLHNQIAGLRRMAVKLESGQLDTYLGELESVLERDCHATSISLRKLTDFCDETKAKDKTLLLDQLLKLCIEDRFINSLEERRNRTLERLGIDERTDEALAALSDLSEAGRQVREAFGMRLNLNFL